MKSYPFLLFIASLLCSCVQGQTSVSSSQTSPVCGNYKIFPQSDVSTHFVGDVMPYYENGTYYVYYLNDLREGPYGFHPIYLTTTTDFVSWSEPVEAIPASKDVSTQDVGLGTGSVIKDKNGIYHFYYVGYNSFGNVPYYEKIQHATSSDLLSWTKHPEDGFFGGSNDFRDPFVFFNEEANEYWMIITTSRNGSTILERYVSDDCLSWKDDGLFYDDEGNNYNMECPSIAKIGSLYYLTFSAQKEIGPERTVNYRISNDLTNWSKPADERLDGAGFYAGRFVSDGSSTYSLGWVATKQYGYDEDPFDWGGNLVCHQVEKKNNGELYIAPIDSTLASFSAPFSIASSLRGGREGSENCLFSSDGLSSLRFESYPSRPFKMDFEVSLPSLHGLFGLSFGEDEDSLGPSNIVFDLENSSFAYFVGEMKDGKFIEAPQIDLSLAYTANKKYKMHLLGDEECLTLYVEGKRGLTTRIVKAPSHPFSIFAYDCPASLTNVSFFC